MKAARGGGIEVAAFTGTGFVFAGTAVVFAETVFAFTPEVARATGAAQIDEE
ncbi:MAG: hypothetical protein KC777_04655 [Cyanobacteria bacterium HKST-UBA02]|nr:hypothetical protein [Cyanobacteria bacterium HKST-UBA02]